MNIGECRTAFKANDAPVEKGEQGVAFGQPLYPFGYNAARAGGVLLSRVPKGGSNRGLARAKHERERTMAVTLKVNGQTHTLDIEPEMPLLWALRDELQLTGTKFGCGIAQCGACTVHVGGEAVRSCSMPVSAAAGKDIVTIEGLASADGKLHPVQAAWLAEDVPQCGYCQSGQIMAAAALLKEKTNPTDEDINGITNICRCGTYVRIRRAIHRAATTRT
jgi:isoquinoline 1-oxidoreductase alpha subunit